MKTHPKPQLPNMCSKSNRSRNMKFEYNVVYENSLDKFDVGLNRWDFSPFTAIQTVSSKNSTLVQARKHVGFI